jgi:hypothetical protein
MLKGKIYKKSFLSAANKKPSIKLIKKLLILVKIKPLKF